MLSLLIVAVQKTERRSVCERKGFLTVTVVLHYRFLLTSVVALISPKRGLREK